MFFVPLVRFEERRLLSDNIISPSSLLCCRPKPECYSSSPALWYWRDPLMWLKAPLNRHDFYRPPSWCPGGVLKGDWGGWRRSGGSSSRGFWGGNGEKKSLHAAQVHQTKLFFFRGSYLASLCTDFCACVYLPFVITVFTLREQAGVWKLISGLLMHHLSLFLSQLREVQVAISCPLLPQGRHLSLDVFSVASQLTHENCKALFFFLQLSKSKWMA